MSNGEETRMDTSQRQLANTGEFINTLMTIPEKNRSLVVMLANAFLEGMETQKRLSQN